MAMKALRSSLKNKDPQQPYISTPLPPISKPSTAVVPPQKVIRATSSYRSPTPQQLSFQLGDFFYVIREVNEGGSWYEAHNPVTGARGLVPKSMFEAFHKGAAP
jgi:bud emergence protein 1